MCAERMPVVYLFVLVSLPSAMVTCLGIKQACHWCPAGGAHTELLEDIRCFVAFQAGEGGRASTQQILDR